MKEARKQTVFLITVFAITAIALFVLQFSMTGYAVGDPCVKDSADLNHDGNVDNDDLQILEDNYGDDICDEGYKNWCNCADIDQDTWVDYQDLISISREMESTSEKIVTTKTCTSEEYSCIGPNEEGMRRTEFCESEDMTYANDLSLDNSCDDAYVCCIPASTCTDKEYSCIGPNDEGKPRTEVCENEDMTYANDLSLDNSCDDAYVCCKPTTETIENCIDKCPIGCPAPEYQPCASNGERYCNLCIIECYGLEQVNNNYCDNNNNGGGGSSDTSPYEISSSIFNKRYELKEGEEIKFRVKEKDNTYKYHSLEVIEITTNSVEIGVKSETQISIIKEDGIRLFELTNDGYYDLQVSIKEIKTNSVKIEVKSINEKVTSEKQVEKKEDNTKAKEIQSEDKGEEPSKLWIYLVVSMGILLVFIIFLLILAAKRKNRYSY